ncbi:hypothetical protein MKZ38_007698 [Zalerion maritima]|uniref:Uncharacterized protein n=1 Tax=Zalerion maritima TaxID=339359 RepID=A0AAD5WMU9_9PEZI|nr:hypothetical protein MKZ38_007698 [Zalerion maritima]
MQQEAAAHQYQTPAASDGVPLSLGVRGETNPKGSSSVPITQFNEPIITIILLAFESLKDNFTNDMKFPESGDWEEMERKERGMLAES